MNRFKTFLTVIGAVTILVLAANSAVYAATGGKFILGHTNKAGKVSTLKRTHSGAALNLVTKSSANAPMTVNGKGKVANLNADMVDGLDSSALRTGTYVFTKAIDSAVDTVDIDIPVPAGGTYLLTYSFYPIGGGSDGNMGGCYFDRFNSSSDLYIAEERQVTSSTVGGYSGFSGSGVATVPAGYTLTLTCYMPSTFTTSVTEPIQVTATRTAVLGSSSLRVASGGRAVPKG